jgi:transcriptional regulator with XRE-family HTH domain
MTEQNRLRELRKAAGFNQQQLAAQAGLSQATLSQLEQGKVPLSLRWMRALAAVLTCSPADLLAPGDNPNTLSDDERQLIVNYRLASGEQRTLIARLIVPLDYPNADSAD